MSKLIPHIVIGLIIAYGMRYYDLHEGHILPESFTLSGAGGAVGAKAAAVENTAVGSTQNMSVGLMTSAKLKVCGIMPSFLTGGCYRALF